MRGTTSLVMLALVLGEGASGQESPLPRPTSASVRGFRVEVGRCQKLSTKNITCHLTITNQQSDQVLTLFADRGTNSSYFVDSNGMQISAQQVQLGSKRSPRLAETDAVTDVPIKASLEFAVGDPRATSIAKLSISLQAHKSNFRVELRKIPLEGN